MLLRVLEVMAGRRGGGGRSNALWTAAAVAAFLLRFHQRREARQTLALRETLRPGESLVISHTLDRQG